MTIDIKDRLYTSSEVAEILGVSLRSVYRYLEEGKLNADIKTATGRHRFSKQNITEFLKPQDEAPISNKFSSDDSYSFQTKNKPDYFQSTKDDFSLDDVVGEFDFKFDEDLDLDRHSLEDGNRDIDNSFRISSDFKSNRPPEKISSNQQNHTSLTDSDLSDKELDELFDKIINNDFSIDSGIAETRDLRANTNSRNFGNNFTNPENRSRYSTDLKESLRFDDLDEEELYLDLHKKETPSLDDDEFDEIFNLRKEQKSTFSWRDDSFKNVVSGSKGSPSSSGTEDKDDFSWLDDLLGEDEDLNHSNKEKSVSKDRKSFPSNPTNQNNSKLNDIGDDFFDDFEFEMNPKSQSSKKSSIEDELQREEEEYLRKLEEIRKRRLSTSESNNNSQGKPAQNFYEDFPSPVKKPTFEQKSVNGDVNDSDDWISRFRKATESLQNSEDNSSINNSRTSSGSSLTEKIDDFFASNKNRTEEVPSKTNNWLNRLGSSQKDQHFYKSGVGNLKEIAQQLDKVAKKFDLDYSFTLHAGLSLHKPIAPFSTIHSYVSSADLEIFEDYLKLTSCEPEDAHLCLIVPKSINIFEESYELHGLSVVSNIQLRSDFIDRGLDSLAREV